jgi:hypothetical protein
MSYAGTASLCKLIAENLHTIYGLSEKYGISDHLFRSVNPERCVKDGRPACRPKINPIHGNIIKPIDVSAPIWYSTNRADSESNCLKFGIRDCETHEYVLASNTSVPIFILDLTGKVGSDGLHKLNTSLIHSIYDYILYKYRTDIVSHISKDSKETQTLSIYDSANVRLDSILSAYGGLGPGGFRNSQIDIDKFFTNELFQFVENNLSDILSRKSVRSTDYHKRGARFVGYYHHNLVTGKIVTDDYGERKLVHLPGEYFPAEFALKYSCAIDPNCLSIYRDRDRDRLPRANPSRDRSRSRDRNSDRSRDRSRSRYRNSDRSRDRSRSRDRNSDRSWRRKGGRTKRRTRSRH